MCCDKCMTQGGIFFILIGVFLWLNNMFAWFDWAQFIAIIIVASGICILTCKCKVCPATPVVKPKRRRKRK